jgi:hypothetical protein
MRILLDENLDHLLGRLLAPHDVVAAAIERARAGSFALVECGDFSRKNVDDPL